MLKDFLSYNTDYNLISLSHSSWFLALFTVNIFNKAIFSFSILVYWQKCALKKLIFINSYFCIALKLIKLPFNYLFYFFQKIKPQIKIYIRDFSMNCFLDWIRQGVVEDWFRSSPKCNRIGSIHTLYDQNTIIIESMSFN